VTACFESRLSRPLGKDLHSTHDDLSAGTQDRGDQVWCNNMRLDSRERCLDVGRIRFIAESRSTFVGDVVAVR
jgi:hypothetical protein